MNRPKLLREIVNGVTISQLVSVSYFNSRLDFSTKLPKRPRGAKPKRFILAKSLAHLAVFALNLWSANMNARNVAEKPEICNPRSCSYLDIYKASPIHFWPNELSQLFTVPRLSMPHPLCDHLWAELEDYVTGEWSSTFIAEAITSKNGFFVLLCLGFRLVASVDTCAVYISANMSMIRDQTDQARNVLVTYQISQKNTAPG